MQERETTSRIRLDELQALVDTSAERAPITARMPAVRLEELLQPEEPPPPQVQVTFRRTPRATEVPTIAAAAAGDDAEDDFDVEDGDSAEDLRKTAQMSAARALAGIEAFDRAETHRGAGVIGTINGLPVHVCGPDPIDAVIDAAVDAAIDAEIHNAEIDAAIDAVVLTAPPDFGKQRYGIVALSFALSFVAGIVIMFMLG